MTRAWATAMREWARLGVWNVVRVRYLGPEQGTCGLCGKTHLSWHYDVQLADGGDIYSIGSKCAPCLYDMSRDWESRHDALEAKHANSEHHAEAERQFTKDTAGLRRRLRVAGQLPDSTVTEKDRLLKEVLSGEMRDRQVKLLGSRLALIERIERLDYPERDEELTLLRRDPPENKVRWLGLRTTSREKKAGESLRR